jgi:hypothetical protein
MTHTRVCSWPAVWTKCPDGYTCTVTSLTHVNESPHPGYGFAGASRGPTRLAPATPTYCWTQRNYSANPDWATGGCNGGSGPVQLEIVCYYFDNGPYAVGSSPWYQAPHQFGRMTCPSSKPFLYTVRFDFTP